MNKRRIKFVAFFAAVALFAANFSTPVGAETAAERYARLKEELGELSEQIETAQNKQVSAENQKANLQTKKQLQEEAILSKQAVITQTENDLFAKGQEIEAKRQVIASNDELLQQRLVALYKINNSNMLTEMFSVDTYADFVTISDSLQRISKNDTELLSMLDAEKQALEAQQAELDAALAQLKIDYDQLQQDINALANDIIAVDNTISTAKAEEEATKVAYSETKEEAEKAYQDMLAASKKASSSGSQQGDGSQYVGGQLTWPVPGKYTISCNFGDPDPSGRTHGGMDISGNHQIGATIVAANDGVVTTAYWGHYSYGNYVVVDHGGGFKTLYAHCSNLNVTVGQTVSRGEKIAELGSTGYSTGPHLHFEVLNPNRTDPRPYLQGS